MDDEEFQKALEIVEDARKSSKLTGYFRRRIAYQMVQAGKMDDEAWLKAQIDIRLKNLAMAKKYHEAINDPCIHLHQKLIDYLKATYGERIYKLLWHLKDPAAISPKWALQFCATADASLAQNEAIWVNDLYQCIISNDLWNTVGKDARKKWERIKKEILADIEAKKFRKAGKKTPKRPSTPREFKATRVYIPEPKPKQTRCMRIKAN